MTDGGSNGAGATTEQRDDEISFSELVRAHYRWARALHSTRGVDAVTNRDFRTKLADFERREGEIVDAYWCRKDASAVALTVRHASHGAVGRILHPDGDPEMRVHRVTDWVTIDAPEIARLLHRCDILAIKVAAVLDGTAKHVAMQWIVSVESHLLGFVERTKNTTGKTAAVFASELDCELDRLEDYYLAAADKAGRQTYVLGMLLGVLLLVPIALATAGVLALFGVLDLEDTAVREFYACFAAGAIGAFVSVLSRMTAKRWTFSVDAEIGSRAIIRLGSYRPILGGIFGLAVYFLAKTPLLNIDPEAGLSFYVVIAFVAGFSERWTRVLIEGAERTLGRGPTAGPAGDETEPSEDEEPSTAPPAAAPAARPADG